MNLEKLTSLVRKAVDNYNMIEDNDNIAIGMSGGKDSIALLYTLHNLKNFYKKKFSISVIIVDIGLNMNFDNIKNICENLNIKCFIIKTDIYTIVSNKLKNKNSYCSLCSKLRKGVLNNKAKELNCNKVAYGHHKNDLIETFFLSLFYETRLHVFKPVTYLDKSKLTVIRPLIYVQEKEIIDFKNKYNIEIVINKCKNDNNTKRKKIKELISLLNKNYDNIDKKIFNIIIKNKFFN